MKLPLSGVTVREASSGVGVRYCGRLFSVMGARVLCGPPGDDQTIGFGGQSGEAFGRWLDEGKTPAGERVFSEGVDLVIGGQDTDDLEPAARLAQSAGASLLALTWFDPEGPYRRWRGSDEIIAALNGVSYSFGERDAPPMISQGHTHQITGGVVAYIAGLAALLEEKARRPKRIDVNILEASLCYSETAALSSRVSQNPSLRLGVNRYVPTYPCSPYRASDGWVGVTCLTPAQWGSLCKLLERPDMAEDPRLDTAYKRLMLSTEVDAALAQAFPARTQEQWVALGMRHRIPIAPMVHPGQLPGIAHWSERGAFADFADDGLLGPTLPYRMAFDGVLAEPWNGASRTGPLDGLRVVDFSMGWAGPLCARTLADLGADVVKIESETHPDWWRGWDSGSVDPTTREKQHNFINVNRNKRGVDIDLTQECGKAKARRLITRADVVVENYAAGVLAKLGLGPDVQRGLKPGLISLSMPAFGNGGPLSGIRAYGSTVEQASGLPFVNGESDWVPAQQHIALGDPIAGLYAASAVLTALYARHRLGGAEIDMAQVACLFQVGADAIIAEQVHGAPVPRTGHSRTRLALCAVVEAGGAGHYLAVAVPDEPTLNRLASIIGGRDRHALALWAATQRPDLAAAELQDAGIPAAPVNPPDVLMADPQVEQSGYFLAMDREFVGRHFVGSSPFRFDGLRPALRLPAPVLGEHTLEVMAEVA